MSLPTVEQVRDHEERYPYTSDGKRYGGLWITQDPEAVLCRNKPVVLRLTVQDDQVMTWNGASFTQPLAGCITTPSASVPGRRAD